MVPYETHERVRLTGVWTSPESYESGLAPKVAVLILAPDNVTQKLSQENRRKQANLRRINFIKPRPFLLRIHIESCHNWNQTNYSLSWQVRHVLLSAGRIHTVADMQIRVQNNTFSRSASL